MPPRGLGSGSAHSTPKLGRAVPAPSSGGTLKRQIWQERVNARPRAGATCDEKRSAKAKQRQARTGSFKVCALLGQRTMLEQRAVSATTRSGYDEAVKEFEEFVVTRRLPRKTVLQIDRATSDYVNFLWDGGHEKHVATRFYAAFVDHFPEFGSGGTLRLSRCKRALSGWSRMEPALTRPPMPWAVVAWITTALLDRNEREAAAAVLGMFTTYCRPSEILALRCEDIVMPAARRGCYSLNLFPDERIERSKVGAANESIMLDSDYCREVGPLLASLMMGSGQEAIFPFGLARLTAIWKSAIKDIGLERFGFVLYQLRHGGPSHDRRYKLRSALEVKLRGRWASDRVMKRYEAHARLDREFQRLKKNEQVAAHMAEERLSERLRRALRKRPLSASSGAPSSSSSARAPASRTRSHAQASRPSASGSAPRRTGTFGGRRSARSS